MRSKPVYKKGKLVPVSSRWQAERIAEVERWDMAGKHIPDQEEIDEIAGLLSEAGSRGELSATVEKIQLPPGIGVIELVKDLVIVYWEGDPAARALINADIEDLPVLLADEDTHIRELAKLKLDALVTKEGRF